MKTVDESPMRAMLIDDDGPRLARTRQLLKANVTVLGEGGLTPGAVPLARELKPDVILVAVEEPVSSALATIESLSMVLPNSPVVALSSLDGRNEMRQAVLAGARDYVVLPVEADELARVLDQVHLHELKRSGAGGRAADGERPGQILPIYGVKGGIGRTMLATNLAVALATSRDEDPDHRLRVALMDLDLQFGDVNLMLNIEPERTIADLALIADKLDADLIRSFMTFHSSGVEVLAAPSTPGDGEQVSGPQVRRILDVLSHAHDFVVVDTPRQLTDGVIAALDVAPMILLLASNQVACLKNTRLLMGLLSTWGYGEDKLKLVMNEAHKRDGVPLHDAELSLEYPLFGELPHDGELVASGAWGKPFVLSHPNSRLSQAVAHLACQLGGLHGKTPGRSLFARLRG